MEEELKKEIKVARILEVAQKRFGLYGVEKTAMREIADDLRLSKASLYYYFPDKESLYRAVLEKEQAEFLSEISEKLEMIMEPGQLLREYVAVRLGYFRTLLNLSRLRLEAYADLKPVFRETMQLFQAREKEIIIRIFEKGVSTGFFSISDTDQTASLFLDLLKGLRSSVLNNKDTLFIESEEYERLLEKTMAFTEIFINGLKMEFHEAGENS